MQTPPRNLNIHFSLIRLFVSTLGRLSSLGHMLGVVNMGSLRMTNSVARGLSCLGAGRCIEIDSSDFKHQVPSLKRFVLCHHQACLLSWI